MLELIKAGGWLMGPLILCSILSLAIIIERAWSLRRVNIIPRHLVAQVWHQLKSGRFDAGQIKTLRTGSSLGRLLAAGLVNRDEPREIMLEAIEDVGRHEAHAMDRFLNSLGTIAAISPLIGLLGTVFGMIKVFNVISVEGPGQAGSMAGGISEALLTTAAGLLVAIPSLIAYRYFRGKVDALVVEMEKEALKLIEALHAQRGAEQVERQA